MQNRKLITTTQKYISDILKDEHLYEYIQNPLIQLFLYSACGKNINWWKLDISNLHKTHYLEICKLSGKPIKLDNKGNVNETEKLLRKMQKQANKVSLLKLKKNSIFGANWNDAENLFDAKKSVDLAGKRNKTKDDKTLLAMDEYYQFKSLTSTVDVQDMKTFLYGQTGNGSYMAPNKLTDEFVLRQYLEVMAKYEKLFQNTKELDPGHKIDNEVLKDANSDWDDD